MTTKNLRSVLNIHEQIFCRQICYYNLFLFILRVQHIPGFQYLPLSFRLVQ